MGLAHSPSTNIHPRHFALRNAGRMGRQFEKPQFQSRTHGTCSGPLVVIMPLSSGSHAKGTEQNALGIYASLFQVDSSKCWSGGLSLTSENWTIGPAWYSALNDRFSFYHSLGARGQVAGVWLTIQNRIRRKLSLTAFSLPVTADIPLLQHDLPGQRHRLSRYQKL